MPNENPSRLLKFSFAIAKGLPRFAMFDGWKYDIITTAMENGLIPQLFDVTKLKEFTGLMSNDWLADNYKYGIILTALNKGLIPEPDVTKLKEFTGLMSNDWLADNYKYGIILTALNNDPIPQLDVTKLKELTGLMSNDRSADNYKYGIIMKAMEKQLIPKLTVADLKTLTELVKDDNNKSNIIITAISDNLIQQLNVEELKELTTSVSDAKFKCAKFKCAIFIAALNTGLQPTDDDLGCFGLSKDNATERFNMIKQVLTNNTPPVIKLNATGLEKLRGLVEDNQHSDITRIAMENGLIPPIDLKTLSHFTQLNDESKFDIIKKAIEKHPTPQLDLEKLKTLTELVRSDERKCAIFIAVLNTGPQLNATGLVNLLGLVNDEQQSLITSIALEKTTIMPSEITHAKVTVICQKLKQLALLTPDQTTEAEADQTTPQQQEETAVTEKIRQYINTIFTYHFLTNEEKNQLRSITDDRKTDLYLEYLGIDQLVIDFLVDALKESFDLEWESNTCLTKRKDFVNNINNKNSSATPDLQGQQTDQEQQLDTTPALPTIQVVEEQPSTNPGFLVGAPIPLPMSSWRTERGG